MSIVQFQSFIAPAARGDVLIVDPAIDVGAPIAMEIMKRGFGFHQAASASAAIERTAEKDYAFALVEMRIDGESTFELVETLLAQRPGCRIVIHSNFCNVQAAVRMIKAGAADVVPKPLGPEFLASILFNDSTIADSEFPLPEPDTLREDHILAIYRETNYNLSRTARLLSMHRRTLHRILKRSTRALAAAG